MPIRDDAVEIQKMTATANNEEVMPETRLNAARRLLRFTEFSARSIRTAKRVAKIYFNNEDVSTVVRGKAASLLEFVLSKPADDGTPLEELTPATPIGEPIVPVSEEDAAEIERLYAARDKTYQNPRVSEVTRKAYFKWQYMTKYGFLDPRAVAARKEYMGAL